MDRRVAIEEALLLVGRWSPLLLAPLAAGMFAAWYTLPNVPPPPEQAETAAMEDSGRRPDAGLWHVLQADTPKEGYVESPESARYRLAGTFFAYLDGSMDGQRRAILDDLEEGGQQLVTEGDSLSEGVEVRRISRDHAILSTDDGDRTLWLSFRGAPASVEKDFPEDEDTGTEVEAGRYGRRVGERRWVLQQDRLEQLYREALDDPRRIAAIYGAFEAQYDPERGQVKGYRLADAGADEFFAEVGLQSGDVIEKVNSMEITSQSRGEYFISEFLQNRLSAVVLDIERAGETHKQIYMIR